MPWPTAQPKENSKNLNSPPYLPYLNAVSEKTGCPDGNLVCVSCEKNFSADGFRLREIHCLRKLMREPALASALVEVDS